jgi:hypothetical protein
LTQSDLQKCIIAKNISSITTAGASICEIVDDYLASWIADIHFVNETKTSMKVLIDTLKFPHRLCHNTKEEWVTDLRNLDNSDLQHFKYCVSNFYLISEHAEFVHNARSRMLTEVAEKILSIEKDWVELNMYDVSAAFMHDTTGQMDGLHLLGPPMKVLMTKFFSHLCNGVNLSKQQAMQWFLSF